MRSGRPAAWPPALRRLFWCLEAVVQQGPPGSLNWAIWGFPKIRGPLFGSPCNKSPTILGSILGPLIFGIPQINTSMCLCIYPSICLSLFVYLLVYRYICSMIGIRTYTYISACVFMYTHYIYILFGGPWDLETTCNWAPCCPRR